MRLITDSVANPPTVFKRSNGTYYLRLRLHGKDVWRSCKTTSKREAEIFAYRYWYELQSPTVKNIYRSPEIPLEMIWKEYSETERFQELQVSTKTTKRSRFEQFMRFCAAKKVKSFAEVSEEVAVAFLEDCGKANKTYNNVRNDLSQAFAPTAARLKTDNIFQTIPAKQIHRGEGASTEYRSFSDDEIQRILEYIRTSKKLKDKKDWLTACQIALYTGLRYKDIALLRWDCIADGHIDTLPYKTASTKRHVLIKIHPQLADILDASQSRKGEYVLPSRAKSYLNSMKRMEDGEKKNLNETASFSLLLKSIGINGNDKGKAGFHSFRSTVITRLRAAGVDADLIGGMVGHTTEKQTEHYNKNSLNINMEALQYGCQNCSKM